jgi:hypothetical protein
MNLVIIVVFDAAKLAHAHMVPIERLNLFMGIVNDTRDRLDCLNLGINE